MKIPILSVALLSLLCFSPILRAQDDAPVDPKRAAAAEELLKAMHSDEMMAKMMETQKQSVIRMTASVMPKTATPEEIKKFQDVETAALDTVFKQLTWESLKPDFIRVYSEVFTEEEIKSLTDFYKTPTGQKFVEKMPELQAKTMELMQKRMVTLMPAIQAAVKEAIMKAKSDEDSGSAGSSSGGGGMEPPAAPPQP